MKTFAIDAMLGNLARKLRVLGFDSKYSSSISDDDLIKLARDENRIILTKDEVLARTAERSGLVTVLIRGDDEKDQIIQICSKIDLGEITIESGRSRCSNCNGSLVPIEKNKVIKRVPPGVYGNQEKFWICSGCQKIYWEGTHFVKLEEFAEDLRRRLG